MKKLKLCLVALATFFLGAQSVSAATEITSGTSYYIQNVGSGLYLCGANSWGTQGSVSVQGEMFTAAGSDGVYTLEDVALSTSEKKFGSGTVLYTDKAGNNWTIEAVGDGSFTIKNDNGYLAQSATEGYHIGYVVEQVASVTDAAKWYFLTKDEAIAKLSAANINNPIDASFLISDANFSRNHDNSAWVVAASNKNIGSGDNNNFIAESWRSAFDVSQTISVPNGHYELTVQTTCLEYTVTGADLPIIYANTTSVNFDAKTDDDGTSMASVGTSYASGTHVVGPIGFDVTDGTLKIGVKGTRTDTWCTWDNFQLKYYNVDLTELNNSLTSAIATAQGISGKMNSTVSDNLATALSAAQNCAQTEDALTEALTNLNNAINDANTSISDYASVPAINEEAAKLDAAGVAAYASTLEAYNNNTLKDLATAQEAYQTAVKAQTTEGADMTGAITNWDFTGCTNGSFPGWTITAPNGGNTWAHGTTSVEYWNVSAANGQFNYSQEITGLPKGRYQLTAKMWNSMNGVDGTFAATSGVYGKNAYDTYTYGLVTDDIDDGSMKEYSTGDIFITDEDGKLTVGVKNITTMVARWFGVDYIKLTYLGEVDINSFYTAIADLLKTAKTITDPQTATATALATAISNADGYESNANVAALQTIQADLSAAVTASQASVKAYANAEAALPEMKKLIDATNVYTAEALETYYTTPAAKYEAKTLTTDEAMALQNPNSVTDWRAAVSCDEFLMSAWDVKSDDWSKYYINTWSKEGDEDGSNFSVPFFEYWTGNDASLGDKTLTATMSDLTPGTYNVSAWVRVRLKDSAKDEQATGITFQANEGEAVDACAGTQVGSSQFRLMTVNATGTVGEDGKLEIKFIVADAETNNISWLSFKNVKFEKIDTSDKSETLKYANNGSLCYDYDATVTVGIVYEFTGIYKNQVYGKTVKSIEAGKPYIAAGDITLTRAYNAAKVAGGTTDGNGFYGVAGGDADVTGLNNDNLIFYQGDLWHANNSTCTKGHGYFVISKIPTDATVTAGNAKALFSLDLDEATGINAINGADANATIYNIAGQRITNAKSGLFIINGKKVVK